MATLVIDAFNVPRFFMSPSLTFYEKGVATENGEFLFSLKKDYRKMYYEPIKTVKMEYEILTNDIVRVSRVRKKIFNNFGQFLYFLKF